MRTLSVLTAIAALSIVACTVETTPASNGPAKKGTTKKVPDEEEDTQTEHGTTTKPSTKETPTGTAVTTDTIDSNTKIPAEGLLVDTGKTVTIAPGTTLTMPANAGITIKGTLKVAAGTSHAKLSGTGWAGVIVESGGTLDADGLDISGSSVGIELRAGASANSKFANGSIDAASGFTITGGKLTVSHAKVKSTSGSSIQGDLNASFMEYDKGEGGGISLSGTAGSVFIADSILKGGTTTSPDYLIANGGKLFHVEYSIVGGSHCALHFNNVEKFELDHVSVENNSYGWMLYGSGTTGPHTVKASNFRVNTTDVDFGQNKNGPITFEGSFLKLANPPANVTSKTPANAAIADAKPRGAI